MKRFLVYTMLLPVLCCCGARNQRDSQPYDDLPIRVMKLLDAAERERDLAKHRWCSISD